MDHETRDQQRINEPVGSVDAVTSGVAKNSKNLVDSVDAVTSGVAKNSKNLVDSVDAVTSGVAENSKDLVDAVNSGVAENSKNLVDGDVSETLIVPKSDEKEASCVRRENGDLNVNANVPGSSKVSADEPTIKDSDDEKHSCVIDVKCGGGGLGENLDGERVCRICHLSSDQSSETTTVTVRMILIHLGCGCKDELGIAHPHCAEAWFTIKGNRMCEICGETAKNVTGVGDNRFMEEWNERATGSGINSSERGGGCWRGQPFCNFLMACLVIAFVLPWFFRVNMF